MNIAEGARRIRLAGIWVTIVSLTLFTLFMLVYSVVVPPFDPVRFGLGQLLPLLIPIALIGSTLWLLGWILDGFAKPGE